MPDLTLQQEMLKKDLETTMNRAQHAISMQMRENEHLLDLCISYQTIKRNQPIPIGEDAVLVENEVRELLSEWRDKRKLEEFEHSEGTTTTPQEMVQAQPLQSPNAYKKIKFPKEIPPFASATMSVWQTYIDSNKQSTKKNTQVANIQDDQNDIDPSQSTLTKSSSGSNLKVSHTRKTPVNRVRKIRPVEYNQDGNMVVNAKYGKCTLISMGVVEYSDPQFHSDRYIFPVGYEMTRRYLSPIDASKDDVMYRARILKDAEGGVLFEVENTETGEKNQGKSASRAWYDFVNKAYTIRNRNNTSAVCGPDLFGLTSAEVGKMIQELPDADKCSKYKWQTFIEQDPSPQKKDNST